MHWQKGGLVRDGSLAPSPPSPGGGNHLRDQSASLVKPCVGPPALSTALNPGIFILSPAVGGRKAGGVSAASSAVEISSWKDFIHSFCRQRAEGQGSFFKLSKCFMNKRERPALCTVISLVSRTELVLALLECFLQDFCVPISKNATPAR